MGIKEKVAGLGTKTLIVLAAFMVVVSAATVAYLSNAATMSGTVTSPFEIKTTGTNMGTCGDTSCALTGLTGGSSFTVTGTLENKANNPVHAATKVICSDGANTMTCNQLALSHSYSVTAGPAAGTSCSNYPGACSTVVPCTDNAGTAIYTVQEGYDFPVAHKSTDQFDGTLVSTFTGSLNCELKAYPS